MIISETETPVPLWRTHRTELKSSDFATPAIESRRAKRVERLLAAAALKKRIRLIEPEDSVCLHPTGCLHALQAMRGRPPHCTNHA
jgi:hypothetical protein